MQVVDGTDGVFSFQLSVDTYDLLSHVDKNAVCQERSNFWAFSSQRFQTWWLYTMDEEQAMYVPTACDS